MPVVTLGSPGAAPHEGNVADYPSHPGFDMGEQHLPMMSQPQAWLHRVHREGLPIVRLWNSKSALLSIGLNQKGKPGLWLTQKVH
jgi:hypothetical protein